MKLSVSFFLVVICTIFLAAQQSHAKKSCKSYGYACYGGHGKRSLPAQGSDNMVQYYPSEANVIIDGSAEAIPKYKLIKMMKSWFGNTNRRPAAERITEFDYPVSAEYLNHESDPAINKNSYK